MSGTDVASGEGGARSRRPAFGFVFATVLMSAVSFSLVIPVLPHLVRRFTGGDAAEAAEWMILFASAWGLAQLVAAPVLGALSDRYGRRPVLLLSTFGLGADFVVMAFAPTLPLLLVARLISGATSATFATANAYVADVTPKEERAAAFGKLASAISIGFITGPALGGWLAEYDLRLPFLAAAAVTLVNGIYGLFVLPESLPREARSARLELRPLFTSAGLRLLRTPGVARLVGVSFLNRMGDMIWGSVWVLYCAHRFGWSPSMMGLQILAAGVLGVGVQAWGVGRVVRAFGERRTLLIGAAISAASLAWAAIAPNGWWYLALMPVAAFGLLLGPGLQGLLSASVGQDVQGRLQGTVQGLNGLAAIFGPPIYGLVFAWSLRQSGPLDLSGLALLVAASFLVGAFVLGLQVRATARSCAPPSA